MFWLGLLLAICYVPGYTGASIPTQWVVLSIILPLGLWRKGPMTLGHKLFSIFIVYALLSLAWTQDYYNAGYALWLIFIWALAYHAGTLVDDLRPLWKGLAVGLSVSAATAVAQALDYAPTLANDPRPSGLFYNSSLFGVLCGLVLVALACHRLWWYTPPLALGLLLSGSRGGIAILAVGLLARFAHWLVPLGAVTIGALAFAFIVPDPADAQRLQIWGVTLSALTPLGHGPGSFIDLHYALEAKHLLIRPEFVHNDLLQLTYEFGPAAAALAGLFGMALCQSSHPDWSVLCAFVALALFFFPLYAPLTAFIGLVVAGSCLRARAMDGALSYSRGPDIVPWFAKPEL